MMMVIEIANIAKCYPIQQPNANEDVLRTSFHYMLHQPFINDDSCIRFTAIHLSNSNNSSQKQVIQTLHGFDRNWTPHLITTKNIIFTSK